MSSSGLGSNSQALPRIAVSVHSRDSSSSHEDSFGLVASTQRVPYAISSLKTESLTSKLISVLIEKLQKSCSPSVEVRSKSIHSILSQTNYIITGQPDIHIIDIIVLKSMLSGVAPLGGRFGMPVTIEALWGHLKNAVPKRFNTQKELEHFIAKIDDFCKPLGSLETICSGFNHVSHSEQKKILLYLAWLPLKDYHQGLLHVEVPAFFQDLIQKGKETAIQKGYELSKDDKLKLENTLKRQAFNFEEKNSGSKLNLFQNKSHDARQCQSVFSSYKSPLNYLINCLNLNVFNPALFNRTNAFFLYRDQGYTNNLKEMLSASEIKKIADNKKFDQQKVATIFNDFIKKWIKIQIESPNDEQKKNECLKGFGLIVAFLIERSSPNLELNLENIKQKFSKASDAEKHNILFNCSSYLNDILSDSERFLNGAKRLAYFDFISGGPSAYDIKYFTEFLHAIANQNLLEFNKYLCSFASEFTGNEIQIQFKPEVDVSNEVILQSQSLTYKSDFALNPFSALAQPRGSIAPGKPSREVSAEPAIQSEFDMTRTSPADTLPANARQISAVVGDRQGKGAGQSTGAGLGLTPSVFAAKLLRDSFKIRKGVETLLKQAGKQHENQASQKHPQGFWDKVKKLLGLLPQSGIANMPKNPAGNAVQRPAIQRSEQDAITRNMTQTTQDIKRLAEEATNAAEASSGAQAQLNPQVASITTQPLSRQSSLQSFVASRHSSMPSLVSAEKSSSSTPRLGNQNQNLQTQGSFEVFPENFPATSASSGSLASEASARAPQVTSSASIASSDAPSKTAESVNIQELLNDLLSTSKTLEDKVILAWQLLQKPEMSQPDEALILETLKFKVEDISTNDSELEHKLSVLTAIRMAMGGFQTNNTWLESAPNDVNMDTMYKLNEMFKITLPRLDALLQSNKLNAKSTALAILAKIPYLKIRISTESFVQWQNFSVEIQFEKPVPFERHLIKNIAGAGTPELLVLAGVSPDQIQINQKTIGQSELNKLMLLKNNISNIGKTLLSEKRPDTASFI